MKYFIQTYGCQYNEWDGARIRFILDSLELTEVKKPEEANVIIILACAVRQTAVDRLLGNINNWQKNRQKSLETKGLKNNTDQQINRSTNQQIIITGCVLDNDKKKFKEKDLSIVPAGNYNKLIKLIDPKKKISSQLLNLSTSNSHYIPIMTGCNNFCSYCAVPYTRGREISRPLEEIITDAKALIKKGEKNIVLLGQNVNSYAVSRKEKGERRREKTDFAILLEKLNALDGDFEISFTSNHPKDMSEDIIEAVASLRKINKEIHLPLQSGSDKILKAMNRPYTKKQYLDIVEKIRVIEKKYGVKVNILTDVIVGFPGETKKDFQQTVDIFNKVKYKQAFINKYSPRIGTKAYKLGDPIPWSEKQRRWRTLNEIANS